MSKIIVVAADTYRFKTHATRTQMSATRLIVLIIPCVTLLLGFASAWADETFHVLAPDLKHERVLNVLVHTAASNVTVRQCESLSLSFRPASIAALKDDKQLIVTSATMDEQDAFPVASIEILPSGGLRVANASAVFSPTGYTSVDRSGRYFMSANYRSGTIAVYRITDNGSIDSQTCVLTTPQAEAHCILTTPDNRFAYVPCVKNNNALYQYSFDQQTGQLHPLEPFDASPPAMFGPRHIVYHPTLPIAYFSNEQQLGISVYEIGSDGQLTDLQHAVTIPRRSPFEQGKRDLHASDLVLTPDGTKLFVAVRDFNGDEDSVFAFRVDAGGKLSQVSRTKVGDIPWKLDLSPDGQYLLVSEAFDQRLSIFKIDANDALSSVARVDWDAEIRDMVVVSSRSP